FPASEKQTSVENVSYNFDSGLAFLVRKATEGVDVGDFRTFDMPVDEISLTTGHASQIRLTLDGQVLEIYGMHGLWIKNSDKMDHPLRIRQSGRLRDTIKLKEGNKILIGDFNIVPDQQSTKILKADAREPTTAQGITSTRSSHYITQYGPGLVLYAHYALV